MAMFDKVEVDVLGVVENMSYYLCPNCDKRHEVFGRGGGRAAADRQGVPFLGEVPLIEAIRAGETMATLRLLMPNMSRCSRLCARAS